MTQCLRQAYFVEHVDMTGSFRFRYVRETTIYTHSYDSEGVLWIRGTELDSPEAAALLVAFHLRYRST